MAYRTPFVLEGVEAILGLENRQLKALAVERTFMVLLAVNNFENVMLHTYKKGVLGDSFACCEGPARLSRRPPNLPQVCRERDCS